MLGGTLVHAWVHYRRGNVRTSSLCIWVPVQRYPVEWVGQEGVTLLRPYPMGATQTSNFCSYEHIGGGQNVSLVVMRAVAIAGEWSACPQAHRKWPHMLTHIHALTHMKTFKYTHTHTHTNPSKRNTHTHTHTHTQTAKQAYTYNTLCCRHMFGYTSPCACSHTRPTIMHRHLWTHTFENTDI